MAKTTETVTAWENPLMPNAKLRQIYLAMQHARALGKALPPNRRTGFGLEACLVSTSVDLTPGDLISDTLASGLIAFLRGAPLASSLHPGQKKTKRGPYADSGAALRLPAAPALSERIWSALGAAQAFKAQANHAKLRPRADEEPAPQSNAVVLYALPSEATGTLWRNALSYAAKQELPIFFVVLPQASSKPTTSTGKACAVAHRCGIPGIPVDANDAVAIYRVAQESIGRARINGGPSLMECVPFAAESKGSKRTPSASAITGLEGYMLHRSIVTTKWMETEAKLFAKKIALEKSASRG